MKSCRRARAEWSPALVCSLALNSCGGGGSSFYVDYNTGYIPNLNVEDAAATSSSYQATRQTVKVMAIQAEQGTNIQGVGLVRVSDSQGGHLVFFFKGRDAYVFDCITPASQLAQVDKTEFQPLIASVRIN